ncbi:mucin-5B [Nomascus leucogenys]|uniref:mucin-5B n=1 Tax=Nomascus leucogenys TaxID=61853 RepID=UPI00122DA0D4|nr:mucin-5B [Nomascus leucogenys]
MGAPSACRTLVLALAAVLVVPQAETQGPAEPSWGSAGHTTDGGAPTSSPTRRVSFVPPVTVFPSLSPLNPAHNGRVCSTWGDFHYKTFDGDVFHFPGLCNYVFSEHCGVAYEDFNVQLRRGLVGSRPVVTRVVIKAQGLVLEASNGSVLINGQREELPYSRTGLLVEQSGDYVKVSIRLVLTFLWNGEDSALLELDPKYANQTCGLCGDFNGLPTFNEFYAHNARLTPLQFGNLQKLDGPTEQCPDPLPLPAGNCTDEEGICHRTLLGPAFAECHTLVDSAAYLAACAQDLCRCPTCPCATFVEYSRQCAHAGGQPRNWRRPELCPRTCPLNMQHQECGSPCADTCSNPQRAQLCEDHCVDGCFCPPGTVLDDITHSGCLPLGQCPCTHSGRTYSPGTSFNTTCSSCTCSGGLWQCQDLPCPGTCSVQGGAHISTYDEKLYDLHGDCSYVLSKKCADGSFTVLAELRKCGLTDNENCLKAVTLSLDGGDTAIRVQADGSVFLNSIYTQLPLSAANITLFTPSSFFIVVQTGLGLQLLVQLVPLMQVFVRLDSAHQGQMCGLCGNFNQNQADDFTALSGVVEATGAAFANTWKAQAACANARNSFEDPCSLSVENENYARHWCSRLTDPNGAFSRCHSVINPKPFHSNCMFDTCNCERSEDCLCAALSSYVHACAAKGVQLSGWRDGVCTKYMQNCPKSQRYAYVVDACQPTCRGLSEADVTCSVSFVPVDGCTCPAGTFLNDAGACVPAQECPCYVHGTVLAPGEVVHDEGAVCSCTGGKLSCLGASLQKSTGCTAPMVYLDCSNSSAGTPGAECLRSCHTLDVGCFSTHCVSGCVCPPGLVSDGSGGCIAEEDCPCVHNEATYKPGETIRVDCNTCTCRNRRWECSHRLCLGTCVAYGDGHFITFDGERYSFEGSCEYILAQDYCGDNTTHGTFRIVTENIPCGTTGTTCSKAIKLFVESYELILQEGTFKAVVRGPGGDPPYKIRYMGIFLVIETRGMAVSWDRKTSVFIRLHQDYKGRVCGLCGNFDDNAINDFATRSRSVVGDALEFGNSWKLSPSCPDALVPKDPCTANPFRKSWAQKQCSILHGPTFAACRSQVDSTKYYEACVNDACACDSGGDCECFCTAVAAYAQACHDAGLCVSWRTPDTCPLFCDFYNPHGSCEWHYQPCGAPCLKTCRNPSGHCLVDLPGLEGCYPKCPPSQPFFNEDQMKCVAQCGCYDKDGNYYDVGARVPTAENCQSCNCTPSGIQCAHSLEACTCTYEDRTYGYQDVIYNTTDGLGACLIAICGSNGTIIRKAVACPGTPATTPFTFTTTWVPHSTTSPALPVSTVCVRKFCHWSSWYNGHRPEPGLGGGDFETFENLRQRGYQVCPMPADIECRAGQLPDMPLEELGQQVDCDRMRGLMCANSQQSPPLCHDYELRVLCCEYVPCGPSPAPGSSPQPSFSASTEPAVPTPTQTTATEKTTLWVTPSVQSTAALTSQAGSSSGPVTVTPPAPGTTTCQPRCQWTEWFDEDYPKSEQLGGDVESYDKIKAAGGHLCQQPKDIECQAESFPNWTLAQVGQKVHCDVRFGLVCRNWEQEGVFKMCYNYRIRVLCCSADHCRGRATTPPPATEPETATTTTTQALFSTPQPASSPGVTRAPLPSTTAVPTLSKGLTSPRYTSTLGTATTGGPTVPAASTEPTVPGVATSSLPTRSALPATTGSSGTWRPSQPSTLATTTMATSRAHPTGTASTGSKEPLTTSLAPTLTSKLSTSRADTSTPRAETTLTPLTEATTSQGTTRCQPKCEWTEWFDVDFPTSGVAGGDMETFENIKAAGGKMCWAPKSIECRAENYPEVSIDQVGQVLTCSLETGLTCKNEDQTGRFNMCFNYNVRVLCCDDYSHCPSTAAPTPTSSTQAPKLTSTGATTGATTPTVTASTATTAMVATTPTATATWSTKSPAVTGPSTLATTQTGPSFSKTTERVPLPSPSAPPASTTSLLPTRGQQTSQAPSMPTSPTVASTPTTSPMVTDRVHTTLQTSSSGPAIRTTLPSGPPSPSTGCVPRCTWTDWFDEDYPSPGPDSGDFETFGVIRSAGHTFCEHPQDIECRSEMAPDQPLEALGQVVQCDVSIGLVCRNRDQLGPLWYCHNFHVRLLCCDNSHCATTPTSTRSITTTPTRTGSMAATSMSAGSTAATPRSTGATARRATTPGTAHTTKVLTTTGITTQATSSTATPYSTQRTAETPKMLTTTTTTTVAASSTATPFATVQTAHTPKVLTTTATTTGSTVTPSNSPGTASTLPALITTTTTPTTTVSMVTPSSIPGTTHTPAVLITTTMTTMGTGSTATPTSSPQTAGTPTELTTTATKITATGSTTTPSSTPRTTPIPLVWNTTAITPAAPSTAGTTNTLPVLTTTSTTHGQSLPPSSPHTVPTVWTSVATLGTTHITEPSTVTSHTPAGTTGTTLHSTPALSSPHPSSRATESPPPGKTTLGLTTATSRTTATTTPSETRISTLLPSSPTSAPTTPAVTTGCEPQCAWSDWLDYSYPMPGPSGGDFDTYSNIRAAGGAVCEQPLGLECRAQAQPGVPLRELGQIMECSLDFGLVCRNSEQVGKFKMCFNYEIRVFCCNYSLCPSTPASSSTATPSSTPGTTWPLTELTTTATTTAATGSTATPSSTPGTTWILTEPTTTATTTVATGSMATASSTLATAGTPKVTTTAITTVATGSTATASSTSATAGTPKVTTTARTPTVTGSKATPSSSPGTATTLPALTSTATTPTATSFTAIPSSSLGSTWTRLSQTTTPTATMTTARPSSTPETAHTSTVLTTTATTTGTTGSAATPSSTPGTAHTSKVLTTASTGLTATASSSPGTAPTLPVRISTTTTPTTSGSTVNPSSIPGTTHTPAVLTTTTTTVATGSMATPSSSTQTTATPPPLTTRVTTITVTGSTTTPSSTPGTTPIPPVPITTATTHGRSLPPSSPHTVPTAWTSVATSGTTHGRSLPPSSPHTVPTAWTSVATSGTTHGRSLPPSSPHTVPTAWTSVATSGTTHITEPSMVTSHTPAGTTGTTLHSTPALSSPHPSSRATESPPSPGKTTLGLTTATSRTTATPSETPTSTLLPSSPTSAPTTPVVTTGCEPQCAWSDWLDYSYPMPGPSGGDFDTYSNIRAAGGAVCEQPLGLECRAQAQPGVPLRELGQIVECSLDFGLVCRNREQVGKFKMCFNYEIRVFCCNYSLCPSTPASSSTATPSSTPGTTWLLTELTTTATTTAATGSTATPSSTPGTTWILTEPTTTATTTVATGSMATASSTLATAGTPKVTTTARTPTVTGSKATPSSSPGTATTLPALTSTATTPTATSFTAIPSSSLGSTWTRLSQTTTPTATMTTARPSSTPETAHTSTVLTTTATTTGTTGSAATPSSTPGTAHTSKVLTTASTGLTATASSSPGTAPTLPVRISTTTTPTTSGSTVNPSSIPGTTHTPAVLTTTTTTVATGSMATPSSSTQTTATPPPLTTSVTTITATGSTPTPSSTPGTTPIPPVPITTGTTHGRSLPPSSPHTVPTAWTSVATSGTTHGRSLPPSSPHMVPTAWTSVATSGTTHITEPSTVTSHTPAGTTGTTLHSTPALSSPHPSSRATESPPSPGKTTLGLTTATSSTTATPSETPTSTLLPSSPTSAPTTPAVTTGCEPQCAWSDWLDYSYPMPGPSGGDFDTYSNIRAAGGAVCEQPLGLECRAQAQPGVPLRELGQIVECSLDFGLVCRNREQVGKFKMCFNYEIRVFCCNYSLCPSTPASSSTATPSSTLGTTWPLTELTTTATTTAAAGSIATPSSTPGTTWILTEPTTTATTTVATGSTATPSSTPGTTWILTEPTTTAITTVAAGSTATLTSTPVTAHPPKVLTSTATTPIASSSKATPSSSARTTTTLPVLTSTATKSTATSFTPIPSSTLWTTWTLPAQTTPMATMSTIHTSSTPETTHTSTVLTTTATTTRATSSMATSSSTLGTTWVLTELTTAATTTAATGSTATPSSTPGTTWILTEPSTTATMTVPSGSMATASSTPGTAHTPKVVTTMATMPTATGSTVPSSSTLGTTHTPAVLPSSLPTFSMSTVSSSVLTTLRPTGLPSSHFSTPCFCRAFGQFFSPGEVIYNKTDRAGCHFYAVCNQHCDIDRFQGACPTSPAPVSSTPLSSPSPAPGCDNAIPPRQVNETWTLENCMVARCVGDNRVILLDPKPVANVTCVNKHLPIKVSDPIQPCDFHYECECICSMWGGSHYSTFDGTSYTFRGNCTYVLMREIHARFGNLSLYLDNNYCAASAAAASCPRALSIHYKSMDIVLTVTMVHGKEEGLTLFDKIPVSSGFSKNGVLVSVTGTTTMRVDIPALGVSITFDGHVFQARLPHSLFHNNTEGQCGTCTNNQRDDCLQRDGTTAASCKDMAKTWLVPDSRKDGCWAPTGTPPTASPPAPVSSTPTPSPCPPQPLCDLMLSQVFAECHDLVPPGPFFNACISDHCGGRPEVPCQSLEAYAALCRTRGVCSDWRGATGGLCDLTCPPTKVYKPCGRIQPATCNSRNQNPQLDGLAEGCFCPEDQILFNTHTGICVQACPCVGPDGFPKFPGERWVSNCQSCVCDEGSVSVQCKPLPCEAQGQPLPCSRPGFVTVTRPRADNPCCPETVCVCDTTTCPQSLPVCPPGQELICTQEEGDCCPTFRCRPQLCSYNGTFYGVGANFPGALPCHTCTCLSGDTQDPTVQCQEDACNNTTCPQGFEYKRVAGQCCGECMQTACLTPDGQPVQLNETWVNSRVDNCTVYLCEVEGGVHLLTPQPASCPDVSSCRGSLRKTGCCYSCEEDSCQVRVNMTVLWHQGCKTEVNITFCEGSCPGVSKYLAEAQAMQHQCTCCQERRVHEETVPLRCPDGSAILHTYTHVDECGCTPFCVPAPRAPPHTPGFLAQEATAV